MIAFSPSSDQRIRRLRAHLAVPLFRNGYSLVAATVGTSVLGMLFWGIAARHTTAAELGIDATLISAMTLIANVAHLNLTTALNRFVPSAGAEAGKLIAGSYVVAGGLTAVAAAVFVFGVRAWAPSLTAIADSPQLAVAFVVSTVAWVVFQLQDSVLTGLRCGPTVFVSNLAYAVVKVALLVVLLSSAPSHGVLMAWVLPLVPAVLIVNWKVFTRLVPRHVADAPPSTERVGPSAIARYVAADYSASMLWRATLNALPLLGLWLAGAAATAHLHVALTITYALYLANQNMGMALVTEAARDPTGLHRHARQALTRTLMLGLPIVAVTVAAAPVILGIFGADYAQEATTLLRLLAASSLPFAVVVTFMSIVRVQKRMRALLVLSAAVSLPALAGIVATVPHLGVVGFGYVWLGTQAAVAGILLAGELRPLWLPFLGGARLTAAVTPLRALFSRRHRRRVETSVGDVLDSADAHWTLHSVTTNGHDVAVAILQAAGAVPEAVLRVAGNATGASTLARHRHALDTIAGLDALDGWRTLVPSVLATGDHQGRPWVIEERLGGRDGRPLVRHRGLPALLDDAADKISTLHHATAAEARVDDETFSRWVATPIEAIASSLSGGNRADPSRLARLGDELHLDLAGRTIGTAFTHGDYWLGNLLVEEAGGTPRVSGILDWDRAAGDQPAAVDTMHLLLSTRCLRRRQPLGAAVVELLAHDRWEPWEQGLLARTAGDSGIGSRRTLLLVTWIHHVHANLTKADRYKRARVWTAANVERVVQSL
jgi:O-antigen/teichoic acid export membrane protein/aminoglycoside phosphotransferase (APT) family kinase protein